MNGEKRLALLIDSDNVSSKYAQFILQEAAKFGELTYKRIYGDWEKGGNGWHYPALNNSIMPVQQTAYIPGKNATDFSMIIDAMDILYTSNVDGFILVTSDSDFTRLAIRLREAGKIVIGIGEVKTPLPFTSSCHQFIYLNQVCEPELNYDENQLRKTVLEYVSENDDGRLDLLKIQGYLTSKFGNINYSSIGFNRFSSFIDSFPEFRRNNTFVTLKNSSKKSSRASQNLPTEREITEVIVGYLKRKDGGHDDISNIEHYVTATLGKIDFSRFGSKRFAKFLDKQNELYRKSTAVYLAEKAPAPKIAGKPSNTSEQLPSEAEITEAVINFLRSEGKDTVKIAYVEKYVEDTLGKIDFMRFGVKTFAKFLDKQFGLKRTNNNVSLVGSIAESKPNASSAKAVSENNSEKAEPASNVKSKRSAKTDTPEKPDLNTVKREIQIQTVLHKNSISLPALGKILKGKYGESYLKDIGAITLKQLVTAVAGVSLSGNTIKIDEKFIERTDKIEQFVFDNVKKNKKVSIKSLSTRIKKEFDGFDFTDYGYSRFSDFINAIDGVRADGYYVEAE